MGHGMPSSSNYPLLQPLHPPIHWCCNHSDSLFTSHHPWHQRPQQFLPSERLLSFSPPHHQNTQQPISSGTSALASLSPRTLWNLATYQPSPRCLPSWATAHCSFHQTQRPKRRMYLLRIALCLQRRPSPVPWAGWGRLRCG